MKVHEVIAFYVTSLKHVKKIKRLFV